MATRSLTPLPKGFHGDRFLLDLVDRLAASVETFVETGSNVGSTLGYVARRFPALTCLSCEPDADAHAAATEHACTRAGVTLFRETSQEFLRRLARDHSGIEGTPVLAWLDAHGYGYEWPLRDEVAYFTERFERGYLLIDDFRVPHDARFGWDAYAGRECAFEHVESALAEGVAYRLYYPAYAEHTSPWHPLRGWGLLQFGPRLEELERLDEALPGICLHAAERAASPTAKAAAAFAAGDVAGAATELRRVLADDPDCASAWNDLGVCLAHLGRGREAVRLLAEALKREPARPDARDNLKDVLHALHPGERPLPVAPGAWGRMVHRDPYDDLESLVDLRAPLIVDGGANRGETVQRLRRAFPRARIHAFEPIPALADHIRARFRSDRRLSVHCAALAAENGETVFRVLRSDVTSSVLEPSALKRRYQGDAVDLAEELRVPAVRMDGVLDEPVDILKLDLQGFELEALRGLGEGLSDVRVVLTEVELAPLYEGQPLFGDIDVALRAEGFRLFHLYDLWSHPDGQMTSGDALYVNERFYA
ncbi:MAG: FkbM family methyltransferase [Planctomycetota bacterium]